MAGPRDTRRYTDTQIQALLASMLIEGHTPAVTVRRALAGELGIPAFHVDRRYIYQLRDNNRDTFESEHPEALARRTYKALAVAHKANLDALEALANDTDPGERTRILKAVAESERILANATSKPAHPKNKNTPTQTNEPEPQTPDGGTLATLVNLAPKTTKQGAKTGSVPRAQNDTPSAA